MPDQGRTEPARRTSPATAPRAIRSTAISLSFAHYRRAEHLPRMSASARPLPKAQNHGLEALEALIDRAPNRRSAAAPGDDRALEIVTSGCVSRGSHKRFSRPVWNPARTRSYLSDCSGSPHNGRRWRMANTIRQPPSVGEAEGRTPCFEVGDRLSRGQRRHRGGQIAVPIRHRGELPRDHQIARQLTSSQSSASSKAATNVSRSLCFPCLSRIVSVPGDAPPHPTRASGSW